MRPGMKIWIILASIVLFWGGVFYFVCCADNLDGRAADMAEKALKASVHNPESIRILAVSKPDSVFGHTYITQEEKMALSLAMVEINRKVMDVTDGLENFNPDDKETAALMADLVDWYNEEETKGKLSPVELAALFHYRYIRIHPFEDGNGRIARLIVNYILARHDYPMIVVRSREKKDYLEALHQADLEVGSTPSIGAHAELDKIRPFLRYFTALVAEEIYNDVRFLTEPDENVWWYDGQRVEFRTPNYAKILRIMQSQPSVTIDSLHDQLVINKSAVQRLLSSLKEKGYIEARNNEDGWRVLITPSL